MPGGEEQIVTALATALPDKEVSYCPALVHRSVNDSTGLQRINRKLSGWKPEEC